VTEGCAELGIEHLTLYAFSTENWNRPALEVSGLMNLLVNTIQKEVSTLQENNVRLGAIGNLSDLPKKGRENLGRAIQETSSNTGLNLTLALSYSGRWEILDAVKKIGADLIKGERKLEDIDESLFSSYLNTDGIPDPELLIRTSGEMRISNFLLWQLAYTELYMTPVLWPDFRQEHLIEAIESYQMRERRFGKTSEQIEGL
jgi:undecaprenyl diphosphate synthase